MRNEHPLTLPNDATANGRTRYVVQGDRLDTARCGLSVKQHRRALAFRQWIEKRVVDAKGEVSEADAVYVAHAYVCFGEHLRWASRLENAGDVKPETLMGYSDRRIRAFESMVKALDRLGLQESAKRASTNAPWVQLADGSWIENPRFKQQDDAQDDADATDEAEADTEAENAADEAVGDERRNADE